MVTTTFVTRPYVVEPSDGHDAPVGRLGAIHKVPAYVTDGRVAIVEHTLPPRHLGAPLHRHSREDELSFVLSGHLGVKLGDDVMIAAAGTYVFKPRGQWHTFWNAGEVPLRVMEILSPGGFDAYLHWLGTRAPSDQRPPEPIIQALAAEYGVEFDFTSVGPLCDQFDLIYA